MLLCTDKSKLIHNFEKLTNKEESHDQTETLVANDQDDDNPKIAVVDGMVLVQNMTNKTGTLSTVKNLAQSFNENLTSLTAGFSEVILVFDKYKSDSLKGKKLETGDYKEKLLHSTRLQTIRTSNTSPDTISVK